MAGVGPPAEALLRFLRTSGTFMAVVLVTAVVTLAALSWWPTILPQSAHLGSMEATPTDPAAVPFYAAGAPR